MRVMPRARYCVYEGEEKALDTMSSQVLECVYGDLLCPCRSGGEVRGEALDTMPFRFYAMVKVI